MGVPIRHDISIINMIILFLAHVDAVGLCEDKIYLEVGKQGVVSCKFEFFMLLGWIKARPEEAESTAPFIYLEGSEKHGRGYEGGNYDIHSNGSLIINNVTTETEYEYTVLFVPPIGTGTNQYITVQVNVFVPPVPGYPVVNGLTDQQHFVLDVSSEGHLTCSMARVKPAVELEWEYPPDLISIQTEPTLVTNTDGTYNIATNSSFTVLSSSVLGRITLRCRVVGQMTDLFPLVTVIDLLFYNNFPVVNGFANQQHVVIDINRKDKLTCSMDRVSQDVSLEWSIMTPHSADEILLEDTLSERDNEDGTFNITLNSSFMVSSQLIQHVTLECRASDQTHDLTRCVTTVELLLSQNFPVVNGLANQQHVVLDINREDKLTCSINRVSSDISLEWVIITTDTSDEILLVDTLSKRENEDGTFNITLNSSFRVLTQSIQRVTLECRASDQTHDLTRGVTTVELLLSQGSKNESSQYHRGYYTLNWNLAITVIVLLLLLLDIGLNIYRAKYFKAIRKYTG